MCTKPTHYQDYVPLSRLCPILISVFQARCVPFSFITVSGPVSQSHSMIHVYEAHCVPFSFMCTKPTALSRLCPILIHVFQARCVPFSFITVSGPVSQSHSMIHVYEAHCVPFSFICIRPCVPVSFNDSCIQSPLCPILIHLYQALCPSLIQ